MRKEIKKARLLDKVSMRNEIKKATLAIQEDADDLDSTNGENANTHDRSFDDEWLPTWKELQSTLNDEYVKLQKSKSSGKHVGNKLPVAFAGSVRCYGCGTEGHKRGDAGCKAGNYDVHASAPAEWRERQLSRKKYPGGNSGGNSGSTNSPASGKPCHQFNFGKGNCSYGGKCKFSHSRSGGQISSSK
jgi:hypothetical protein